MRDARPPTKDDHSEPGDGCFALPGAAAADAAAAVALVTGACGVEAARPVPPPCTAPAPLPVPSSARGAPVARSAVGASPAPAVAPWGCNAYPPTVTISCAAPGGGPRQGT
jgi:hypothetical protein